jgi:hypothetical protein
MAEAKERKKTGPKRTPFQHERDLVLIAELYLRGRRQVDIADQVNMQAEYVATGITVTQSQVSHDIKKLHDRWVKKSQVAIDQVKARELARLDELEMEYWESWLSSKKPQHVVINGQALRVDGKYIYESPSGDPRFLQGVERIVEQRRKVFGLDAPAKVQTFDMNQMKAYVGVSPDDWDAEVDNAS